MLPYEDHFSYHASAVAFGARFSAPPAWEASASVALPSMGGRATAAASHYLLDGGFVRFASAGSEVVGDQTDAGGGRTSFRTRATTWIEGLRIGPYLEIDSLQVGLESRYLMTPHEAAHEPEFLSLDVQPRGVRVCGRDWRGQGTPELDWANKQRTFASARGDFLRRKALPAKTRIGLPEKRIYSAAGGGSLVSIDDAKTPEVVDRLFVFALEPPAKLETKSLVCPRPGCAHAGAKVEGVLGGVGLTWTHPQAEAATVSFRFGEYVVTPGRRRFTAVRMWMTRSPRSEIVVAELELNGAKHP
ncbi:MAG: hypothetical protein ABW221_06085 [Vicinamibacteria bacterium]